jgi:hypothetical protein
LVLIKWDLCKQTQCFREASNYLALSRAPHSTAISLTHASTRSLGLSRALAFPIRSPLLLSLSNSLFFHSCSAPSCSRSLSCTRWLRRSPSFSSRDAAVHLDRTLIPRSRGAESAAHVLRTRSTKKRLGSRKPLNF